MIWLLDSTVLLRAQDAACLEDLLRAADDAPMALVEEVYREITDPRSNRPEVLRKAVAARGLLDTSNAQVIGLDLSSPAVDVYARLRGGKLGENDKGECASIALAHHQPEMVFVTADRKATFLALNELGRQRVESLPQFLRTLVEAHALDRAIARSILAAEKTPAPTWWGAWSAAA